MTQPTVAELLGDLPSPDDFVARFGEEFSAVYPELRRIASHRLASLRRGQTLQTTALVHEAYLKLSQGGGGGRIEDRGHLLALASRAMRFILVDAVRARVADKRGGAERDLTLDEELAAGAAPPRLLDLDRALARLEQTSTRLAQVVEMHFFGGIAFTEIAAMQERNERTVRRDWEKARLFLQRELHPGH